MFFAKKALDKVCKIVYSIINGGEKMNPLQETIKDLKRNGFVEARQGKKHTIFYNPQTHQTIPVKRHDFNENDRRYILREAKIK